MPEQKSLTAQEIERFRRIAEEKGDKLILVNPTGKEAIRGHIKEHKEKA